MPSPRLPGPVISTRVTRLYQAGFPLTGHAVTDACPECGCHVGAHEVVLPAGTTALDLLDRAGCVECPQCAQSCGSWTESRQARPTASGHRPATRRQRPRRLATPCTCWVGRVGAAYARLDRRATVVEGAPCRLSVERRPGRRVGGRGASTCSVRTGSNSRTMLRLINVVKPLTYATPFRISASLTLTAASARPTFGNVSWTGGIVPMAARRRAARPSATRSSDDTARSRGHGTLANGTTAAGSETASRRTRSRGPRGLRRLSRSGSAPGTLHGRGAALSDLTLRSPQDGSSPMREADPCGCTD